MYLLYEHAFSYRTYGIHESILEAFLNECQLQEEGILSPECQERRKFSRTNKSSQ